ncbi:MAG TPA: hypothetical protein PLZ08_07670 [Bacillota bacterium]|nr:hypothetical protein [Bacillota bacterium]HOL10933.1 hypothetical protein [Bacillota bacterium]HPO97824.1 hypothetical protein [Bacillota bacterium]
MIIKLHDQEIKLNVKELSVVDVIDRITELIEQSDVFFSHLKIDTIDVYDHYEQYLEEHWEEIKQIEVMSKSYHQMINETLNTASGYLERILPEAAKLVKALYQGPTTDTWSKFAYFLEGLQWIVQVIETIQDKLVVVNYQVYQELENKLAGVIKEMSGALENLDYILIADTINYEVIPILEATKQEMITSLKGEVSQDDLN